MTASKVLGRQMVSIALYAEKYLLSLLFLYFAWVEFHTIWSFLGKESPLLQIIWFEPPATRHIVFAEIARHVVAFLLNFFTSVFLLLGRRAAVPPQKFQDILVPLTATLFVLIYDFVQRLPISLQKSFCPPDWRETLALAGLSLGIIGSLVAVWGLFYLGRSFGIFVEMRKVVFGGPYRWVRHPMYLGYICMLIGIALINFSIAYFVLVPVHVVLLIYRAHLEETRLSEHDAEYREYQKRSGFISPKFHL